MQARERNGDGLPCSKELLHGALDLPASERRAFLEARMGAGRALDEALQLVLGVEDLDGFLETPLAQPSTPRQSLPGRIGPYEIEGVIGWGSMGVVYAAHQERPRRKVALKLLRQDVLDETVVDRFHREADVLARLSHPGIATVYEAGVTDLGTGAQPWFAMEHVDGESLTRHAEVKELDRRGRVRLVESVTRAIAHAHEQGVLHRDLKPENVLVRGDGTPCVLDFGVAGVLHDEAGLLTLTATGHVIGTLAYMAPEQARGVGVGVHSDQYALGAMLYELLTGELPRQVRGDLPPVALRRIADGEFTPPTHHEPTLAGELEAILATCLAPDPGHRYASVGAFGDDLRRWLDGKPVHARAPSALTTIFRTVRRHPGPFTVSTVVLVLLGAALAFAWNARSRQLREAEVSLFFSDIALTAALTEEAEDLWPLAGRPVARFERWLDRADGLRDRLGRHRAASSALPREGAVGRRGSPGPSGSPGADGASWRAAQFDQLIAAIESLHAAGGLRETIAARLELARSIHPSTVERRREEWETVAERVAADERFDGFVLAPQWGLVPLGPDPASGLEEFAVFGTGDLPSRPNASSPVRCSEGDAVVLVLVPGGARLVGVQTDEPTGPNFYARSGRVPPHEGPPVRIELDPFLIGKFEMTQDQWVRFTGDNPSLQFSGGTFRGDLVTSLHPVESISWQSACEVLERRGLRLPTEAQWEVAARAGAPWPLVHGPTPRDVAGYVSWCTEKAPEYLDGALPDGVYTHVRVDDLLPNRYGLHHVIGNVWEYCLDTYKVAYHELEHRPGDGLVLSPPDGDVPRRGSGWADEPINSRVYRRDATRMQNGQETTGVRAARPLASETASSLELWPSAHPF